MSTPAPLIDRYLQAVSDAVPGNQREEVTADIRSALADAVDAHLGRGEDHQAAELAAVTELGDPAVLAARYTGQPLHLIGPAHFPSYRRLLRILLLTVVPVVSIVVLLATALDGAGPIAVLGTALWTAFQVGIQVAFWVTVVFAAIERTGASTGLEAWTPDNLPEVADRRISLLETVLAISATVLLIVALILSRTHWLVTGSSGAEVPVLAPDLWTFWMPLLLIVLAATVVLEIVKYRTGRWTVTLAAVNTALNLAFAGIVVGLWTSDQFLNPAMTVPDALAPFVDMIPWIVAIICIVEIVQGWIGARRT